MTEQGSQGFQDPRESQGSSTHPQPDSHAPDPNGSEPYRPDSRADAAPRPLVPRPRKWNPDGKKVRMKNAQGVLEYVVFIVSAKYDDIQHTWMYTLNDWEGKPIAGETRETMLG